MNIYRYFVLVVALLATFATISGGANEEENVYVSYEYLTDSEDYNYGVRYFLSSTVNEKVVVRPYVVSRENVIGSVTSGPVILEPNESNFFIGEFISADHSKPWAVTVGAKWNHWDIEKDL